MEFYCENSYHLKAVISRISFIIDVLQGPKHASEYFFLFIQEITAHGGGMPGGNAMARE